MGEQGMVDEDTRSGLSSSLRRVVMRAMGAFLLIFGFVVLALFAEQMINPPCGFCDDLGDEEQAELPWPAVLIIAAGAAAAPAGAAVWMRSRREHKPLSILSSSHEDRRS